MGVILNKQSWHLNEEEENINKKELNLWVMPIRMVEKRGSVLLHLVLFFHKYLWFCSTKGGNLILITVSWTGQLFWVIAVRFLSWGPDHIQRCTKILAVILKVCTRLYPKEHCRESKALNPWDPGCPAYDIYAKN